MFPLHFCSIYKIVIAAGILTTALSFRLGVETSQGLHRLITSFSVFSGIKMCCFISAGKREGEKAQSTESQYKVSAIQNDIFLLLFSYLQTALGLFPSVSINASPAS